MLQEWFSTPIYYEHYTDLPHLRSLIPHLKKYIPKKNVEPLTQGDIKTGVATLNSFIHFDKKFKKVFNFIEKQVNEYAKIRGLDLKKENLYLGKSWVNFAKKGSRISEHNHAKSYISGVIYLNTSDINDKLYVAKYRKNDPLLVPNKFTNNTVLYKVEPGKIILFPGDLNHGVVSPYEGDDERVCISFDFYTTSIYGMSQPPIPKHINDKLLKQIKKHYDS